MSKEKKTEILHAKSLEDAIKQCKVNEKVWETESYSTKELSSGEFLYTIYFKRKIEASFDINQFVKAIECIAPRISEIKHIKISGGLLAEVGIFDLHCGKLGNKAEVGHNYDIKIAAKIFREAIDYKIRELKKHNIERILFEIGNDFFQCDNEESATSKGTRVDSDTRFHKMFQTGSKLVIEAINKLQEIAPIDCYVIPGNHARIAEFLLGEVLTAYYKDNNNVFIENSPTPRKYYKYGKNLIGMTHGDDIQMPKLPLIMAAENPKEWGETKWRYFKIGHYHSQKMLLDEYSGVLVEVNPALSGTDYWHKKKAFSNNVRAAITSLYDRESGLINKIYFNYKK